MLTIYGVAPSIHTRKVIVAALEKNIDYRLEPVFPFDPPVGWRELSPTGRIPAIADGDFRLADSSVIVAYLERKYPRHPLTPSEPRDYAQTLWIEEYCDGNIAPNVIALFHQKVLGPAIHKRATEQAVVDDVVNVKLPPQWDYLESLLHGEYFVGNALTVADITIASELLIYHYLGFRLDAARYPKLNAHFKRMLCRPSFQTALQGEELGVKNFGLDKSFLDGIYPAPST